MLWSAARSVQIQTTRRKNGAISRSHHIRSGLKVFIHRMRNGPENQWVALWEERWFRIGAATSLSPVPWILFAMLATWLWGRLCWMVCPPLWPRLKSSAQEFDDMLWNVVVTFMMPRGFILMPDLSFISTSRATLHFPYGIFVILLSCLVSHRIHNQQLNKYIELMIFPLATLSLVLISNC